MDLRFQRMLIEKSLKTAGECTSESLRDFFTGQAARQQAAFDEYLSKNPPKAEKKRKKKNGSKR